MLKSVLASNVQLVVPGVFDALSSHVASQSGFKALYMSGFAVSASLIAKPDIGLVTASEMAERAHQIVYAAHGLPVIADGDNGYGNEHNVARLVHAYETAGVACIQLEDQVSPKRCGHMENKQVVNRAEAVSKIAAAVSARSSDEFLVMARTDARATHNLDEALARGEAFIKAGADILFIEAPHSIDEMRKISDTFPDVPLVANMVEDGKTPDLSMEQLSDLGFQIILRPVSALLAATRSLQQSYSALESTSQLEKTQSRFNFAEFNEYMGLNELT